MTRMYSSCMAHKTCHSERRCMDPEALWRDLHDEMKALAKSPENRDVRLHVCSLLDALSIWIRRNGFPPDVMKVSARMVARPCTCTLRINPTSSPGRLSQEQKGLEERALMASQWPSRPL
jgi:hypothetical protein